MSSPQDSGRERPPIEYVSRCRILRTIAVGGMGTVYLGEQVGETGFAKTVAVKIINKESLQDPQAVQMFIDEAKLTADLIHQNILQVYNLASYKGMHFIVMEYVHGVTCHQFMQNHRAIRRLPPVDLAAFIVSRVCRGLNHAHTKPDRAGQPLGIVHRDVTPSNIMIDFQGVCKLSDFGIAKALTMHMPDETRVIMGKLPYMSPEQANAEVTDPRSDLFSLGLVFYELLTGQRIYQPKDREELVAMMNTYRIKNPQRLRESVDDDLAAIVMKVLEKDPDKRFQTAKELGDALEVYMYHDRYGPTNEKLAEYVRQIFPDADPDRIE